METGRSVCAAKSMAKRIDSDCVLPKPIYIIASHGDSDACDGLCFTPLFLGFSS